MSPNVNVRRVRSSRLEFSTNPEVTFVRTSVTFFVVLWLCVVSKTWEKRKTLILARTFSQSKAKTRVLISSKAEEVLGGAWVHKNDDNEDNNGNRQRQGNSLRLLRFKSCGLKTVPEHNWNLKSWKIQLKLFSVGVLRRFYFQKSQ